MNYLLRIYSNVQKNIAQITCTNYFTMQNSSLIIHSALQKIVIASVISQNPVHYKRSNLDNLSIKSTKKSQLFKVQN